MKLALVVIAAATLAGLGGYALFNALGSFSLMGNTLMVNIDRFVWLIAVIALLAAALALGMWCLLQRRERTALQGLAERVARLESGGRS